MPFSHRDAERTEKFCIRNKEVFIGLDTTGMASSSVVNDYLPPLAPTHTKIQNPSASLPVLLSHVFMSSIFSQ